MNKLNLCSEGLHRIIDVRSTEIQDRLLEMGFLSGNRLYIICNNSLGIQVRINRATYLLNEVVASVVYVEPIGE
jgi:Fe2+ transport system protein FeoA